MTSASCAINLPSIVGCTHCRTIIPSCSIKVGCILFLIPCLIVFFFIGSNLFSTCILVMLTGHPSTAINSIIFHWSHSRKLQTICSIDNLIVLEAVALREITNFYVSLHKTPQYEFFSLTIFSSWCYFYISM